MHDWRLLRQYVDEGSNRAFDEILERYGRLVYSCCLREVGDPELARDVFQTVFMVLARKAPGLARGTILSGWLCQTARLAGREALRQEMRRAGREKKAASMEEAQRREEDGLWNQVDPPVHHALGVLSDFDRNLILLRFFHEMTLREAGEELGLSENAARMRVTRSLAKMRRFLEKHGASLSVAALATLLGEHAAHSDPPAEMIQSVSQAASSASIPLTPIMKGVLKQMLHKQIRHISLAAGGAAALIGTVVFAAHIVIAQQSRVVHKGDIGALAVVHQYLAAHAASNITAANALLSSDSRRNIPTATYDNWPRISRAQTSGAPLPLLAFIADMKNSTRTQYQIVGAEQSDPNVVDVTGALPNAKPITIKVVTTWDDADNARRIDAMQTVASTYPPLAHAVASKLEATASMSNMKTLSIAIYQYAQATGHLPDANSWMDEIMPYVKDASLFHDPSDPNQRQYGYAYNSALSGLSLNQVRNPPGTVLLFESTLGAKNAASLNASLPDPGPINGGTGIAFVDGHVEIVAANRTANLNWQP